MEGRLVSQRTAIIAGLIASLTTGCSVPKTLPKREKPVDAEVTGARAVHEGMQQEVSTKVPSPAGGAQVLRPGDAIWMQPGKSKVLEVPFKVTRVSIGNPDLAGVVVLGPKSILVNAKELPVEHEQQGLSTMTVQRSGLLSSHTFTPPPQIGETTVILWDSANHTSSHTIYVADFVANQVLLEVTIAELDRTKMEQRGVDFQNLGGSLKAGYWLGGGQPLANELFLPSGTPPTLNNPPPFPLVLGPQTPTFAFQSKKGDITALVTMLQTEGLATVLAQPKILALSGQNAVFQVGGEIPIRIVTSFSAEVEFKAFGTLVNFLPRVSDDGDIILTVTPEVSQPDFSQEVEGIPTFRVRRASTTAKLKESETLVLGGLTQRLRTEQEKGIPYLKDVPYVGVLFRQTSYEDDVTELMVIVTPHFVKNLPPGTELPVPSEVRPLQRGEVKTQPNDAPVTRPRLPTPSRNSGVETVIPPLHEDPIQGNQ